LGATVLCLNLTRASSVGTGTNTTLQHVNVAEGWAN
jgi:hypothetical protein